MLIRDLLFNAASITTGPGAMALFLSFLAAGCSTFRKEPTSDLRIIYEESAQYHLPDRNPIIVIPGILGSKLVDADSGRTVWGAFEPAALDPARPEDARLIALPITRSEKLSENTDHVEPGGVLETVRVRLFGVPLEIRAYAGILSTLGVGGYRDEALGLGAIDYGDDHFTCFQFDYDWRRDNVENAQRLKAFIDEKRAYIEAEYEKRYGITDADVKFDIVAHSMGGLVARYFMRYGDADVDDVDMSAPVPWTGAEDVERVVLVGTPSFGSVNAFTQLIDGYDVGRPILPYYAAPLLGTFPSIYELMPRPRHKSIVWKDAGEDETLDIYDPALWERYGWGLASLKESDLSFLRTVLPEETSDTERRDLALAVQEKTLVRAKRFHDALDRPAMRPEGVDLVLVAGDAELTPKRIEVDRATGRWETTAYGPGDGTVLRTSATADERVGRGFAPELQSAVDWSNALFLFSDHLGLTQDEEFADNVLYWLLEAPRHRTRAAIAEDAPSAR